jgi:O-antigen/teichoic acid export membrane protein
VISKVKFNILANYFGSGWQMAMGVLFVPLYIRFLGIESYGIIGFFASLQAALFLLDMGLSTTFSREIARLAPTRTSDNSIRNSLATFSRAYWIIAIIAGAVFIAISPLFGGHWLKAEHTSVSTIRNATILMGFSIIVRWPGTIYSGGINSLQKQVLSNVVTVIMSTIRGGGVVLLLWLVSPTLSAFFLWQIGCNLAQTIIYAIALQIELKDVPGKGSFDWGVIRQTWKFSAGMLGINIISILLSQTDKILLSKLVSLEQFGYYTLAGTVAGLLFAFIGPVTNAMFPRFTELVALRDETNLASLFHLSCQFVSFVVFPLWTILAFFPKELLFLWTNNNTIAKNVGPVLTLIATGNMLNLMMYMPFQIQMAYGYTKLIIVIYSFSLVFIIPLIFILVHFFGIIGGASVWVILNSCSVLIVAQFFFWRFLKTEKWRWYFYDILHFAVPCILSVLAVKYFSHFIPQSRFSNFCTIGVTLAVCLAGMFAVMPRFMRHQIVDTVMNKGRMSINDSGTSNI